MPLPFFDTNILIYAVTDDRRVVIARQLLAAGGDISVQILSEFSNVARRKLGFEWGEIAETLAAIGTLCRTVHPITVDTHRTALMLAERFGFAFSDALIVASALHAQCTELYSEDLHHGLVIDGRLNVINPFRTDR